MNAVKLSTQQMEEFTKRVTHELQATGTDHMFDLFEFLSSEADRDHYEVYLDTHVEGLGMCDVFVDISLHVERTGQYFHYGDFWSPPEGDDGRITRIEYVINGIQIWSEDADYFVVELDKSKVVVL